MASSSRKPYIGWEGPRLFFVTPSRHLKESNAKESSFEKPYAVANYNLMHQEPNIPAVPEGSLNPGGIEISFVDGACGYGIKAIAGITIPTIGGPEEDKAGWREPMVEKGEIVSWKVSGPGLRRMDIVLNEAQGQHLIKLTFLDSWGYKHITTVTISCAPEWTIPVSTGLAFYPCDAKIVGTTLHVSGSSTDRSPVPYYASCNLATLAWAGENASANVTTRGAAKLAVTSGGVVNIFYDDQTDGDLKVADNTAGWSDTVIEAFPVPAGQELFIGGALADGSDKLHVVYSHGSQLRYATNATGSWVAELIEDDSADPGNDIIDLVSVACFIGSTFHVLYRYYDASASSFKVKHAYGSAGSWSTEIIASTPDYFGCTIFAEGSTLHAFYCDLKLKYLKNTGGGWSAEKELCSANSYKILGFVNSSANLSCLFGLATSIWEVTNITGDWNKAAAVNTTDDIFATIYYSTGNTAHIVFYLSGITKHTYKAFN